MTFSRPMSRRVRSSERHLREISRSYMCLHPSSHWIALHTMRYIVCFICLTPRGDKRVQSRVDPDCATFGTQPTYELPLRSTLKIGNVANQGDERCGSERSNAWDGSEDFALPTVTHHVNHFCFELGQMLPNEIQFADELLLLDHQTPYTSWIFGANTLCCSSLHLSEVGIRDTTVATS